MNRLAPLAVLAVLIAAPSLAADPPAPLPPPLPYGSVITLEQAKQLVAAARNRRPTKYDQDRLAAGNNTMGFLPDLFPFGGGQPIVVGGKVIGGVGVTGGADDEVAIAGVKGLQ